MSAERAVPAYDLPYHCGIRPLRVSRLARHYVECPTCIARTVRCDKADDADHHWRGMLAPIEHSGPVRQQVQTPRLLTLAGRSKT